MLYCELGKSIRHHLCVLHDETCCLLFEAVGLSIGKPLLDVGDYSPELLDVAAELALDLLLRPKPDVLLE